jgi:26S proteasome regulatory subunit N10
MKKNNTSIDIVAFGDLSDDNIAKLQALNEAVKGGEGSHLEIVPPGPNLLSDSIVASPILAGEGGGAPSNGGGAGGADGGDGFEFGIDPSVDPELALALRMSLEEDRARQERERKTQEDVEGKTALDSVPEGSESQPLLDGNGEPHGSASGSAGTEVKRPEGEQKKDKDDDDKMNTD